MAIADYIRRFRNDRVQAFTRLTQARDAYNQASALDTDYHSRLAEYRAASRAVKAYTTAS